MPDVVTLPVLADPKQAMVEMKAKIQVFADRAMGLKVTDKPTAEIAATTLSESSALIKAVEARGLELRRPATAYNKQVLATEAELLEPLKQVDAAIKKTLGDWQTAERLKAEAEAQRLRDIEIAKAREEAERQRKIAEDERQKREEAEAKARAEREAAAAAAKKAADEAAEIARKAAEAAAKSKNEAAQQAAKLAAAEAEAARLKQEAEDRARADEEAAAKLAADNAALEAQWAEEEKQEELAALEEKPLEVASTRIAGFHQQNRSDPKVTDLVELCRAIGAGEVSPNCVKPDMAAIKASIKLGKIPPGVTVGSKTTGVNR